LNKELSSGFCLIDTFPNHFLFISANQKNTNALQTHHNKLNNIYEDSLTNQDITSIITDTSIKNNIAISVSHIHKGHNIINRSVHHTMNINLAEAKLFIIRCGID